MKSIKHSAANVAATAKSGVEKTKATVQEKAERMTAHNPAEKEMATERKEERVHDVELHKQEAHEQNAAAARNGKPHSFTATGMSAGHHRTGKSTEGTVIKSRPIGTAAREAAAAREAHANTTTGA